METTRMTPFQQRVFETEEFSCSKSFSKEFAYRDRNHPADTVLTCTNSDFSFTGPVLQLRLKNKNKANYTTGYAVFHTSVPRGEKRSTNSKYASTSDNVDHVCILDLETFCDYFVQPRELAESLTEKAEQLVAAWMQKNGGPGMTGNRRPIGITYTLAHYEWLNAKNRKEESKHTLQLSTWGYTGTVQQSKNPIMGLNDVKVLLKLKSSTNAAGPTEDGQGKLRYDGSGYGVPFLHFAGMLRSERFGKFQADVTETWTAALASGEEEEDARPPSKRQKTGEARREEPEEGEISGN